MAEEMIQQFRVAMRNESSRRVLAVKIARITERQNDRKMKKHQFKKQRRLTLLQNATPGAEQSKKKTPSPQSSSLEE